MSKEYIAYEGKEFTIEWYFDINGKSSALEYYKKLAVQEKIKVLHLFKRMGDAGVIKDRTKFNYEGDQLYTFKPKPDRYMCFFFSGKRVVITNAFRKMQQKLPRNEKDRAQTYKEDYESRIKKVNTMKKHKKAPSTFEREMKKPRFKREFEKSYKEFILSELLIAFMENDEISVRNLAKEIGLSPTIIQNIRSGKQADLKVSNFVSIAQFCGYKVILEKDDERIEVEEKIIKKKHHLHFVQTN